MFDLYSTLKETNVFTIIKSAKILLINDTDNN